MRFVNNDGASPRGKSSRAARATLLRQLEQLARNEGEFLQSRDDHRHRILKSLRKLPRAFVDLLHDTTLVLELVDRVLKLLVEHHAVGYHDHAVEDALIGRVVQGREPMR